MRTKENGGEHGRTRKDGEEQRRAKEDEGNKDERVEEQRRMDGQETMGFICRIKFCTMLP